MSKQSWDSKCAHAVRRQLILQYKRREKQNVGTEEGSNKNRLLTATIKKQAKVKARLKRSHRGSQTHEVLGRRKKD